MTKKNYNEVTKNFIGAREVLEVAENYYEESVEGWNRAAAMEALDKASEAYAVAKRAWEDELIIFIVAASQRMKK